MLSRCNGNVRLALNNDKHARLRFAALQSDVGRRLLQRCGRRPDDLSSIVLVTPDGCHIKSDAVLKIAQQLRQPFPILAALVLPLPSILRDALYDQVCVFITASLPMPSAPACCIISQFRPWLHVTSSGTC